MHESHACIAYAKSIYILSSKYMVIMMVVKQTASILSGFWLTYAEFDFDFRYSVAISEELPKYEFIFQTILERHKLKFHLCVKQPDIDTATLSTDLRAPFMVISLELLKVVDKATFIGTRQTNKMTCAPREDTDQMGIRPSLISVFAMRFGYVRTHTLFKLTEKNLIRLHMPRLIWIFAWRTCCFAGFVMHRLKVKE